MATQASAPKTGAARAVIHRYTDDSLFDNVLTHRLPDPKNGYLLLLVALGLQGALILLGFVAHHYKQSEFGCCNMWAVAIALLVLGMQYTYWNEWRSPLGEDGEWHRANIFVPFYFFVFFFILFLAATMSMLSHAIDEDFFSVTFDKFSALEIVSFIFCTSAFIPAMWFMLVISWAHRNNLGVHYYAPREGPVSLTHMRNTATPQRGTYHYRNLLLGMAKVLGCGSATSANRNLPKIIVLNLVVQVPFYVFAGLAYHEKRSNYTIIMICLSAVLFLANGHYFLGALGNKQRKMRSWNRSHIFFSMFQLIVFVVTYFFVVATMFFQPSSGDLWEDILVHMDGAEVALFVLMLFIVIGILAVQFTLAYIHRKGWADGTLHIDDGENYNTEQDRLLERQMTLRAAVTRGEASLPSRDAFEQAAGGIRYEDEVSESGGGGGGGGGGRGDVEMTERKSHRGGGRKARGVDSDLEDEDSTSAV